jgi:Protein of unknown function (DUF559)
MERTNAERTKDPERLAALLDRQHLVVATWQMKRCGYSEWAARRAVRTREFDRLYRGVLTVAGTHLTFKGRCMAAALACGRDAVISHHAAAALWDLRPIPQIVTDVTAPTQHSVNGIRSHVSPVPQPCRTHIDAIPVTTLERTYLDYAEQATPRQLTAALEAADRRHILDLRKLRSLIDSSPGRKGIKTLNAAIIDMDSDPQWTQSPPELDFLHLIAQTDLPQPLANRLIEGHLVDFVWPAQRLIVEIDSYDFHTSRAAFEADRVRDAHLQTAGWRVLRITARRLQTHPQAVVADVRQMLNQ